MITDIILSVLQIFLTIILSPLTALKDASLDPNITGALSHVQGFISTMNPLFPIDTLLLCIGTICTIELAIFTYKCIMWLIKKIPMIN